MQNPPAPSSISESNDCPSKPKLPMGTAAQREPYALLQTPVESAKLTDAVFCRRQAWVLCHYPRKMTQLDVSLTDYGVAVECVCFSYLTARRLTGPSVFPSRFITFFLSIAIAGAAGGTVHGFFLNEKSLGNLILWRFTLIVIGITALTGIQIGVALQFSGTTAIYINRFALAFFLAYIVVVLFVREDFLVAIVDYLPGLAFMGSGFLVAYRRIRRPPLLVGFLGICLMLFAAAAQQAKLGINPQYFDHNALYHLLQAIALFMIFLAAREVTKSKEPIN